MIAKILKDPKFWCSFLFLFGLLQLIPVEKSNPPPIAELKAPKEVLEILNKACYDCHSTTTNWPWYSYVFPISVLVTHHVKEGREELNFSNFENLNYEKQMIRWESIIEEIEEGEMPPRYYNLFHKESRLTQQEIQILKNWKEEFQKERKKDVD